MKNFLKWLLILTGGLVTFTLGLALCLALGKIAIVLVILGAIGLIILLPLFSAGALAWTLIEEIFKKLSKKE